MSEMVPFQGQALSPANLKQNLQKHRQQAPASADACYLKMEKDTTWVYGIDKTPVKDDAQWAVNPTSVQSGYICWDTDENKRSGGPLDELMFDAGEDIPPKHQLPHRENGEWAPAAAISLVALDGPDKGLEVTYKVNSKSGVAEVNRVVNEIVAQIDLDEPFIPIVVLDSSSYNHKKYGKTLTPVLDIIEFVNEVELAAPDAGVDAIEVDDEDVDIEDAEVVEPPKPTARERAKGAAARARANARDVSEEPKPATPRRRAAARAK